MFKFLKNKKFLKIISFLLICVFSINLVGCDHENNVSQGQNGGGKKHYSVGVGNDINGYGIYAQSSFDPMNKELFMGYLLSSRSFSLVVLPGRETGDDENPYELIDAENVLFTSAHAGVYDYNELLGTYDNPEYKALLYYVTDLELLSWFNEFEEGTGFLADAVEFASSDVDLEKPERYKCRIMVNLGSGLNANDFCGTYSSSEESLTGGLISNDKAIKYENGSTIYPFSNSHTGGMILFFGYGSIEGYMTYEHIMQYKGSEIANSFDEGNCYYNPGFVGPFDFNELISVTKNDLIGEELYSESDFANYASNENLKSDIISVYTEKRLIGKKGCARLKETYKLLEQSLLTDNGSTNISALNSLAMNKKATTIGKEQDKWSAIYEMIQTLYAFYSSKVEEQFNIKLSSALHTRYNEFKIISNTEVLSSGKSVTSLQEINFTKAVELINNGEAAKEDYVVLVTAEGFIHDRGTEEDQVVLGASEMMGYAGVMQELIRMDACPNGTIAAEMYNMLANLKIVAGTALAVAGVTAMVIAGVGLAVASVIAKAAALSLCAPVPGGRIVALVLIAIAGLVALTVGLITLFSGLKDKARMKGMGASEENYCKTYAATFNLLFETLTLTVPVYHFEIAKDNDGDSDDAISINYCDEGTYDPNDGMCKVYEDKNPTPVRQKKAVSIPMYYYADREQSEELNLEGMPAMLHFKNGELIDSVYGAATPAFIVEALRFWGLLAMREIVYKASLEEGKVNVKHTTNTNARTMRIMEARYCYTTDFEKNLYAINDASKDPNDFCYFNSATPVTVNINKNWSGDTTETIVEINISDKTAIENKLNALYNDDKLLGYFADLAVYQYNSIKNTMFSSVVTELTGTTLESFSSTNTDGNIGPGAYVSITYVANGTTSNLSGSYYSSGDSICVISGSDIHLFKISGGSHIYYGVVATFNSGQDVNTLATELDKSKIGIFDFFSFIIGDKAFDENTEVTVKLYMTATIKESPQSTYYYKDNGTKKECEAGEHVYEKTNFWGNRVYTCVREDKVKSKHTPISTYTIGRSDVQYNYYSTSVAVADLVVGIDQNGAASFKINWLG